MNDLNELKFGFIGSGLIADAIITALIKYSNIDPKRIFICGQTDKYLDKYKRIDCNVSEFNYDIFDKHECDVVFLCFHGSAINNCYSSDG